MPITKPPLKRSSNEIGSRRINTASSFKPSGFGRSNSSSNSSDSNSGGLSKLGGLAVTISLSLIFFLCPIFFTGISAQGFGFEKMMLFSLLTLVGSLGWVLKSMGAGMKFKRTPLDIPIVAFLVILIVSTLTSVGLKDSLIGTYGSLTESFFGLFMFILFYYLVVNNINEKRLKCSFKSLVLSSGLVILYSLMQVYGAFILPVDFTRYNSFNPVGSLSGLTVFGGVALAMFLAVFIRLKDTLGNEVSAIRFLTTKAFLIVSILATTILLIILNGFTFWAAIVFTMALILLSSFTKIIDVTKKASIVITVFTALSVILLVFNTSKPNFDFSKIFKVSQLPAEVSLTRGASWEIAKQGLKDSPIFGTGPATFYYDFDKYKGTGINNTELWNVKFDNSTGILFSLLSTVGVLGTLAVGALLFISLFFVFGTVKRLKEEEDQLFIFPLFIGFATAIFFSIFVGFNSALTIYSVLIGVLTMAVSVSAKGDDSQILNLEPGTSKSIAIFSSIAFTLLLFLGVTMTMADVYAKQSVLVGGVPGKISMLEKAIGLAPYQDSYYVALSNHYIALANGSLGKEDVAATGVTLAKGVEIGKKAVAIAPGKASNYESLALLYENAYFYNKEALNSAEQTYKKQIELEPDSPTPYLRLGLVNMARAREAAGAEEKKLHISESIKLYNEAINRKANLASAYYGRSIAYEALGDLDNAIKDLTSATIIDQNSEYIFELGRLYLNRGVSKTALEKTKDSNLNVKEVDTTSGTIKKNADLSTAEQLFLSILLKNQDNANARYSLSVLYNKVGDKEKAGIMVKSLLRVIQDEKQKEQIKQEFPGLF